MFYGSNVWDPVLISAQIISVQCVFYITLGLIQAVTLGPSLGYLTVSYIFDWGTIHFKTKLGWYNWCSHVVNSIAAAGSLAWIVERAKKCLDFGATCYFWHMIFVWWYSGWPQSLAWWLANGAGMLVMVLLGEWFCVRREMQDIPLSIPQRLSSGLLSRRKESGQVVMPMMPLPTEDPDLPPRPRLRTGLATTMQRPAAAAAAAAAGLPAAAGGGSSSFTTSDGAAVVVTPPPPPPPSQLQQSSPAAGASGVRPGGAVQLTAMNVTAASGLPQSGGSGGSVGSTSRKKLSVTRPASLSNLSSASPSKAASPAAGAASSEVEPA